MEVCTCTMYKHVSVDIWSEVLHLQRDAGIR